MKTLPLSDLKTNFSEILKAVQLGEEFAIAFGKRKIGVLEGKTSIGFNHDFKITIEEFLGE